MPLWWPEFPGFELKKSLKNGEIAMSVGGAHRKLHSKCLWWPEFHSFELKRLEIFKNGCVSIVIIFYEMAL
jgi:hypothetical protein